MLQNALAIQASYTQHTAPTGEVRLLTYSRLVRFKNLGALVTALTDLPQCTLTIAGSGPDAARLQSLVQKLGVQERVQFVGLVPKAEAPALFAEHDALLVPSYSDISPNAALEALASGLPVLITAQTGLATEYTDHMCCHVLRTPANIVAGVQSLLKSYNTYAVQAVQNVPSRSWEVVAREHVELFTDIKKRSN